MWLLTVGFRGKGLTAALISDIRHPSPPYPQLNSLYRKSFVGECI